MLLGMRTAHGDMFEVLILANGTLKALGATSTHMNPFIELFPRIEVRKDRMLKMVQREYSCATELANVLVRECDLDNRSAHQLRSEFCKRSNRANMPADQDSIKLFNSAPEITTGKNLAMSEEYLR
jgi:argininosuccinate lyase